jgi:hypothetical protein
MNFTLILMVCTLLRKAVFIKNRKFPEKVPDNFGISEIPKKSFPRNPGNFPRHFPKFPDFPEIPGFSKNSGIFRERIIIFFYFRIKIYMEHITASLILQG